MCVPSFGAPWMESASRSSLSANAGAQDGSALSGLCLTHFFGNTGTPLMTLLGRARVPAGAYSKPNISAACLSGLTSFFSKTSSPALENLVPFLGGPRLGAKFVRILASGPTACNHPPFPSCIPLCPWAAASTRPASPNSAPAGGGGGNFLIPSGIFFSGGDPPRGGGLGPIEKTFSSHVARTTHDHGVPTT